jgi:hypothetical protein
LYGHCMVWYCFCFKGFKLRAFYWGEKGRIQQKMMVWNEETIVIVDVFTLMLKDDFEFKHFIVDVIFHFQMNKIFLHWKNISMLTAPMYIWS